jgi:hypothetical protein
MIKHHVLWCDCFGLFPCLEVDSAHFAGRIAERRLDFEALDCGMLLILLVVLLSGGLISRLYRVSNRRFQLCLACH